MTLFLLHGAVFVSLKTDGPIRLQARHIAARTAPVALAVAGIFAVWTQLAYGKGWTWAAVVVAAAALAGAVEHLDAQAAEALMDTLRTLAREQLVAIVVATHHLDHVDRQLVVADGTAQKSAPDLLVVAGLTSA